MVVGGGAAGLGGAGMRSGGRPGGGGSRTGGGGGGFRDGGGERGAGLGLAAVADELFDLLQIGHLLGADEGKGVAGGGRLAAQPGPEGGWLDHGLGQ